ALARQIGARSVVLAANPARLLPLDVGTLSSVALIGALARDPRVQGGGSATVFPRRVVSPLDGLAAALPDSVKLSFAIGADPRERLGPAAAPHWTGLRVTFRDAGGRVLHENALATGAGRWLQLPDGVDTDTLATVEIFGRLTAEVEGTHQLGVRGTGDFVLMAAGRILFDGGGERAAGDAASTFLAPPDRRIAVQLTAGSVTDVSLTQRVTLLPGFPAVSLSLCYAPPVATPDELLAEAEAVASAADVAVVVVGTTEEVESEGFDRTTLRLPGRQDELVRRVAAANSRTAVVVTAGSPVELPWADDVAAVVLAWFGGQECGHALADVLLGTVEPGGRLPTTWPARESDCPVLDTTPDGGGVLRYDEGVFIGYRGYERAAIAPRYPFGHGLGYTTWAYDQIRADARQATITVRNTGSRAGREVVQVYAGPAEPDPDRPARWLAGFAAVTAGPGESRTVTIELPERTFQRWVARRTGGGWQTIPGEYVIEAARGRGDIRLATSVRVG
ncbi:MAG: glycoside hydrolase family 3 C-terminal domain-containing protein, partial [Streptosporangiaceae bacterium]